MKITNRHLEEAFHFSFPQVKRWAVACLGKDPGADQAKGVHREYEIDDGYKIFFMGNLVMDYRFGLDEAKRHIENIWDKFASHGLLPSQNWDKKSTVDIGRVNLTIFATEPPAYHLEWVLGVERVSTSEGEEEIIQRLKTEQFPKEVVVHFNAPMHVVPLNRFLGEFITGIKKVI
jgi:hypothetical protein